MGWARATRRGFVRKSETLGGGKRSSGGGGAIGATERAASGVAGRALPGAVGRVGIGAAEKGIWGAGIKIGPITPVIGAGSAAERAAINRARMEVGSGTRNMVEGKEPGLRNRAPKKLTFEEIPKHGAEARGKASAGPRNGQEVLEKSIQIKDTSARRVGVDPKTGEFVVFDETHPGKGIFHGHVRAWEDLTPEMQKALIKKGLVTKKGKIIER